MSKGHQVRNYPRSFLSKAKRYQKPSHARASIEDTQHEIPAKGRLDCYESLQETCKSWLISKEI